MTLLELIILLSAATGVVLLLISSYGMVRMHGVHQRMQAASVGASLGITALLVSAGLYYAREEQLWRMLALVALFFLTGPIATTAIARAAYRKQHHSARRDFVHDDMADPAYVADYVARDKADAEEAAP